MKMKINDIVLEGFSGSYEICIKWQVFPEAYKLLESILKKDQKMKNLLKRIFTTKKDVKDNDLVLVVKLCSDKGFVGCDTFTTEEDFWSSIDELFKDEDIKRIEVDRSSEYGNFYVGFVEREALNDINFYKKIVRNKCKFQK